MEWEVISMDFITGLPMTWRQHDSIMFVVDKLTKVVSDGWHCKDLHEGDFQIAWITEGNSFR